jgi:LPXTG-site transpeptidase (sortase) family protein
VTVVVEAPEATRDEPPPLVPRRWTHVFISRVAGIALCSLSVALFCFLAEVSVVGRFEQSHNQQLEYATLRYELANAVAPIGPRDYLGNPLPLGAPVALLDIPSIGLNEVVDEGTTSGVLEKGPGHLRGTVMPGQAGTSVIMARVATYGGPFRYIDQLQQGDTVTVTTGQGTAGYRVLDVRRSGDHDPAPPAAGQGRLTLITAGGPAYIPTDVVRVDADLLSNPQPNPGGAVLDVDAAESARAGDPGAWPQIILWSQLLLIATAGMFWARFRWGRAQAWLTAAPVLCFLGLTLADQIARLLPNLL